MIKYVPLSNGFFITSIIEFFLSVFFIAEYSVDFAMATGLVFILMFIASFISMSTAPIK